MITSEGWLRIIHPYRNTKGKSNSYYLTAISTWMMLIIDKMTLILVEVGLIVYIQN